jgi:hypothetical protein
VRSGSPQANEMVRWTISSDERPERKRRARMPIRHRHPRCSVMVDISRPLQRGWRCRRGERRRANAREQVQWTCESRERAEHKRGAGKTDGTVIPPSLMSSMKSGSRKAGWRCRRDSNPRYGFTPYNGLANRRLQPLGHSTIRTSAALPGEDRHHAGREGRPFALVWSGAQGGFLWDKSRILALFARIHAKLLQRGDDSVLPAPKGGRSIP